MTDTKLREALAAYAHDAWAGWMKYLFSKCLPDDYGEVAGTQRCHTRPCPPPRVAMIPTELVARWQRQMNTPYAELPESEKESDRAEAEKMLAVCKDHAPLKFDGWFLNKRNAVKAVLQPVLEDWNVKAGCDPTEAALDALEKAGLLR